MKTIELTPTNGRKSFYGKCKVLDQPDKMELLSYETIVAEYDKAADKVIFYNCQSTTTANHIRAFLEYLDKPTLTKKEIKNLIE